MTLSHPLSKYGSSRRSAHPGWVTGALTGRFVEGGAEGLARLRGDGHAVVGLEDETAGSLLAVMLHVVAVDEGKVPRM